MLRKIVIESIKSIDEEELTFGNLNLLVGMNSAGKSTVIQTILFAIQCISNSYSDPLNGSLISWGDFSEVKNYNKHTREFSVNLTSDMGEVKIIARQDGDDGTEIIIEKSSEEVLDDFNYHNRKINYLSSKRIGGQDLYNKNYDNSHMFGINGEFSVHYYDLHKGELIADELRVESVNGYTLEAQLNHWLKSILNTEIRTESIPGTDKVKLSYIHGGNGGAPRLVRPKNIGAGLSYVISILIAALSAKPGDLIIVENPEIQLHPKAQSRIIEFITHISDSGVQFIIESHSDHIFNGVRKSIKNNSINKENVEVYFFGMDQEYNSLISNIEFNGHGAIINHKKGLFDQFDDDLDELLGLM